MIVKKYGLVFLFVIGVVVILIAGYDFFYDDPIYIAVAGPLTGKNQHHGEAMLQGVDLYLDKINREGGIYGKRVKRLAMFDDRGRKCDRVSQNDPNPEKCAEKVAHQIIASPALAVIGHYSSDPSTEAAKVYKSKGIPAITGTATADEITKDNKWYFRVIFKNRDQTAIIANYARKILGYKTAYIVYDNDSYGQGLKDSFSKTAARIGLTIQNEHQWTFDQKKENSFKDSLNNMIETLETVNEEGILFLATHSIEAMKVIRELRRLTHKLPIIGPDALSSSRFIQIFKQNYPQEKAFPGYYTDGIYVASPFLLEIAGKRAQDFYQKFKDKYHQNDKTIPVTSALYYDATMVAVEAIKNMLAPKEDVEVATALEEQRKQVRDNLRQLSRLENAVEGVTGYLYFDSNGDAIKSIPIGIYKKGKPVTAWYQYQPLTHVQEMDNLLQEILAHNVIQVNDKFMQKAQVVYTGIDFNNISELDLKKSAYKADFYLWFRFLQQDEELPKTQPQFDSINFVNIFDPKDNNIENWTLLDSEEYIPEKESKQGKVIIKTYRLKTQFKVNFDFHDYPLDKQIVPIRFRHNQLTTNQMIYVVDREGMELDKTRAKEHDVFSGWKVVDKGLSFFQNTQKNDSTLGNPKRFDSKKRLEYSQFNVEVKIERHVVGFLLKTLLPTLFVLGLGYAVYFTNVFATKMALSMNLIISTSLFHLKLASSALSSVEYNVLIEYVFYLVYLLGIFGVVTSLIIHAKDEKLKSAKDKLEELKKSDEPSEEEIEQTEKEINKGKMLIKRIEQIGRIGYPIPIVFILSAIWIFYRHG
jgi:branched-chain amino acid transport system substrate-binding protein